MAKLYFPKDLNDAKRLSRQVSLGRLNRIRQGIYTDAPEREVGDLLRAKWYEVVEYLFKDAIASHITAVELQPVNNTVFVTANVKFRKKLTIADALTIEVYPGHTHLLTEPFVPNMQRSTAPRYLMENLQFAKKTVKSPQIKSLGKQWVEGEVCKILERRGEDELNHLRFLAYKASTQLAMEREFKELDIIIGAILSSQSVGHLNWPRTRKKPYDAQRIDRFTTLATYLMRCELVNWPYHYSAQGWRNLSFYESYFSNTIEGTEFAIEEAENIVFSQTIINNRHQDSHALLSLFNLVDDHQEMVVVPNTADELLNLLKQRHEVIMFGRPEKRGGQLRDKFSNGGGNVFVSPQNVEGTLLQAFKIYQSLPQGAKRAIFIQFVVTQCQPFDEGNGRLARVMMNAELAHVGQHKLIVPTVHRDSYRHGLRAATRSRSFRTMTKVFSDMQAYSASIDWQDYGKARQTLEAHCADKLPDVGVPTFNQQLSRFRLHFPLG